MSDPASFPTQLATPPAPDPHVGKVIGDRYRLLGRIGEGGMGLVYRAEHVLMRKTVALKLLHGDLGHQEDAVRRFEREAQSASRLSHPNIIAVTDFGRAGGGELYLVMEYVAGHSLGQAIEKAGRLSIPRALAIVRQILSALAHAHRQGVVHRDLKPANVMLTRPPHERPDAAEDTVKILDFGIAKMTQSVAQSPGPDANREPPPDKDPGRAATPLRVPVGLPHEATQRDNFLTQGAMIFGTPSYMSPEQAMAQEVDPRADLYSCGVILYEMLTGRKPFVANELARVLALQVTAKPPPFSRVAPDAKLPAALEAAVRRAMEKERDKRFQTAEQFLAALDNLELSVRPQEIAAQAATHARAWWGRGRAIGAELWALYDRLPWRARRWSAAVGVATVVLMLVIVPTLCHRPSNVATTPPPPRPPAPSIQEPLGKAEDALARGRLAEARAMLLQLLSKYPQEARVHYLLGNLEFVDKKLSAALDAYGEALRLDPGLRADAALLVNVRSLLGDRDRKLAWQALTLTTEKIGRPAADELAEIGTDDRRTEFREAARAACLSIGCGPQLDLVKSYALDLSQARTCDDKREAVKKLASVPDLRAVEALKKARGVRGALGGLLGGGNDCVRKDIDAALKERGG